MGETPLLTMVNDKRSTMVWDDTIVAISSAVGPAARMIIRMSGPAAFTIISTLTEDSLVGQRGSASRVRIRLSELSFPATVYWFRAPHSATGEDVIEIHLPGNPILARLVLNAAVAAGARQAEPGEFTSRSYFNGRLDLSAAEGVSAVISAQNQQELDAARRLLSGELPRRLGPAMELLAQTLALVETGIDFAEEDISVLDRRETTDRINRIIEDIQNVLNESSRFERLAHEPRIVLVGRPNAGKSTLLNVLAGTHRAIVSPVEGTTRDALSAYVMLNRGIVTIVDVAGMQEDYSENDIARRMHAAAVNAVASADVIVLVREVGDRRPEIALAVQPHLRIRSKADLSDQPLGDLCISAHARTGLSALRDRLDELAFGHPSTASSLALNSRHIRCIGEAVAALVRAGSSTQAELIALELREALDAVGTILGSVTPDDVLGRIFSRFCIGK